MKSNVNFWIDTLDRTIDERLEDTGLRVVGGIMEEIVEQDLVDTTQMLGNVDYAKAGDREIQVGTDLDDPNYPFFLNNGFIHWISGELVGPFRFMEGGWERAEPVVKRIWREKIRARRS